MKASILIRAMIVLVVFSIAAALMTPPDPISQLTIMFGVLIVYGLLTLIISRFKSLKQTPESIKKLIIVMVCLLSISITCSVTFFMQCHQLKIAYHNLRTVQSDQIEPEK